MSGATGGSLDHRIRAAIRDVPDFPRAGIVFKDVTPVLGDSALFRAVTDAMAAPFRDAGISHVLGVESRGFILGGPVAHELEAGFVPIRKVGKLPCKTVREEYALEYGSDQLEIHADAVAAGARVLIVDDVLATGGTAAAACRLAERLAADVVGLSFLLELEFLGGARQLSGRRHVSLVTYRAV